VANHGRPPGVSSRACTAVRPTHCDQPAAAWRWPLRRRLALFSLPYATGVVPATASGAPSGAGAAGALRPQLVFFQHDEVIVHCPEDLAGDVVSAVGEAAAEAGRLVFGPTPVRFPVTTAVVSSYADAK